MSRYDFSVALVPSIVWLMRLLDRYLLRELLFPLTSCVTGFLLLWITSDLTNSINDFQDKKMLGRDIAQYYLLRAPEYVVLIMPIALLLALLYALNHHARYNEITAMRAAGLSLWRIAMPYFAVGVVAGAGLFALNEFAVPDSADAAEEVRFRRVPGQSGKSTRGWVRNLCFNNARDGRTWRIGLYHPESGTMMKPIVSWMGGDRSRPWQIQAERGVLSNGVWTFFNVREFREMEGTNLPPFPSLETNVLAFPELSETTEEIRSEIKVANTFSLLSMGKGELSISEIRNYLRLHPQLPPPEAARLYTKLHERLAQPFTCLVVVLIALPFGAASGRRNVFVGVASSVIICMAWYFCQQLSLTLGAGRAIPPWAAGWLPNALFAASGLLMSWRVR